MESNISIEIPACMKQHLMLLIPNCSVMCRGYLCDCVSCLQFIFDEYFKEQGAADIYFPEDLEGFEDDKCHEGINHRSGINKFLILSVYHHLCLILQAIQQNHFISLKLLTRELKSKT